MYKAGAVRLFPTLKGVIGALGVFSGPIAADDKSRMLPRAATCEISNTSHDTHLHYSAARGAEYWNCDFSFSPPALYIEYMLYCRKPN